MSKIFRRRFFFASFRRVASLSLLSAALVSFVGCAGGSNPFCCGSKEKNRIDQNLERAQSLDEREQESTPTEESDDGAEEEATIHANILRTDGSGDATQIAAATPKTFAPEPQKVPVTASTSAAAEETSAQNDESTGLLQAPVLPTVSPAPQPAQPTPVDVATPSETPAQPAETTVDATETPAQSAETTADATETPAQNDETTASETSSESKDAQDNQNAQEEAPTQNDDAPETQEEKTDETTINAARLPRRAGPQRAATRQVAQRASNRPVAVPQTRAAATLAASEPIVVFRTRAVVPAVATPPAPTPVVAFRTRTVVP